MTLGNTNSYHFYKKVNSASEFKENSLKKQKCLKSNLHYQRLLRNVKSCASENMTLH